MTTYYDPARIPSIETLLPDQFVRLHAHLVDQARRQVDDADEAEDIAQETLIAAWQAGVGWSAATLDRVLADRCRGCQASRQDDRTRPEANPNAPVVIDRVGADAMASDAGLADVELRLTIVESLRRSAVGELGVAVFALRRAGLRPADVRAVIGGSPKAVNDALAMLGRIARRVLGSGPANDRPPDQPGDRSVPMLLPLPTPEPTTLPPVPPALAQTHPIAAALVRAGAPVAASPAVSATPVPSLARQASDERLAGRAALPSTATTTRGNRLRAQQQERARAVERAGRRLEQMRRYRQQARTPDERLAADARLAAAAVRYERARAVLGDLERQQTALPATASPSRPRARQLGRGQD